MIYHKTLTVLVIEDVDVDAELIRESLDIRNFSIYQAGKLSEALQLIAQNIRFDAILLDLILPDSRGIETLETIHKIASHLPIIILSGVDDEETIFNSLQKGAQDYLLKGEVNSLVLKRSIRYAIERKQTEQRLNEALDVKNKIFSATSLGVLTYRASGQCIFANEAAAQIVNTSVDKLLEQNFHLLQSWKSSEIYNIACEVLETGKTKQQEINFITSFGKEVWVDFFFATFFSMGETHLLIILNDKTHKKCIEKSLEWKNYLLDMLLKNSPISIYFKDLKGRIREASKSLATKLGIDDVSELIGKTDFDLFSLQHANKAFLDEHKIISTGEGIYNYEERETHINQPDTWVISSKMPLFNTKGDLIGTFGISRDITERKKAEDALIKSKAQLDEAMDVAQLYQWTYNIEGSHFIIDEKLWKFLGKENVQPGTYNVPITEYFETFVHDDDKYILINDRKKAQENTDPEYLSQIEYRIVRLDGAIRHIMVRTRVEMNEFAKPLRYYGILQDITERKIALQEAYEALNRVDGVKTEVLTLISREIRTPLNGIVGAVNLIKNQEYSSAIKDLVEILDKSVSNLESFTDNAIYYSKLIKNYCLNVSEFSLKDLIQFAVLENENAIVEKKLKILFESAINNTRIRADKDLIYKLIANILLIFIDISKTNNSITIDIIEEEENDICSFVSNDGNVFPEDILKNYASVAGVYDNRRIGLSLYIVKKIMDLHQSEIQIFNNDNARATIKLLFSK